MKHIKTFEKINTPEVGDYIWCNEKTYRDTELEDFISSNVGELVEIKMTDYPYYIKYENIPYIMSKDYFIDNCREFSEKELIYFNKNKELVEVYMNTEKYNL